jgi:hypothetical protein
MPAESRGGQRGVGGASQAHVASAASTGSRRAGCLGLVFYNFVIASFFITSDYIHIHAR